MKFTKSEYLMYLDAPRHLWAYINDKFNKKELDTFTAQLIEQGYEVQKYAHEYVKEYLIPNEYQSTSEFYFEVTKSDGPFEVRIDLVIYNNVVRKWDIYEIKSTNSVNSQHIRDVTFQYLVLQNHYKIDKCYVLHLNSEYIRKDILELDKLFTRTEITSEVKDSIEIVNQERFSALEVMKLPDFTQTDACIKPKKCPCIDLCHPVLPKYPIYEIARLTGTPSKIHDLEVNYSKDILDIPSNFKLSDLQRKQVDCVQSGKPTIEIPEIKNELDKLVYPLYFLDYESFNPAVPMYDQYKPYDQMPFQYSLHIQNTPTSEYLHKEFIETNPIDPSITMIEQLVKDIGNKGSIIIWSKFERTQNKAIARRYSEYSDAVENINSRLWDLMDVFMKMMYLHADFRGSYSIKKVLPVLCPELSYKGLAISDGSMAMTKWVQMVYGGGITATDYSESDENSTEPIDIPEVEVNKDETRENLLRYCELDTWAMVRILETIKRLTIND